MSGREMKCSGRSAMEEEAYVRDDLRMDRMFRTAVGWCKRVYRY